MIHAQLIINDSSGRICNYDGCKHLPEHFDQVLNTYYIKKGARCLFITIPSTSMDAFEIYCRDCIDRVYHDLKPILDSKLWILT